MTVSAAATLDVHQPLCERHAALARCMRAMLQHGALDRAAPAPLGATAPARRLRAGPAPRDPRVRVADRRRVRRPHRARGRGQSRRGRESLFRRGPRLPIALIYALRLHLPSCRPLAARWRHNAREPRSQLRAARARPVSRPPLLAAVRAFFAPRARSPLFFVVAHSRHTTTCADDAGAADHCPRSRAPAPLSFHPARSTSRATAGRMSGTSTSLRTTSPSSTACRLLRSAGRALFALLRASHFVVFGGGAVTAAHAACRDSSHGMR